MTCLGKILILMVLAAASLTLVGCSSAHLKHATKDQAQTMATKAANAVKKDGDKTFTAFNNGGEWRDGDLYVFVIDKTGTWRASGAHPELVGKNDLHTADSNGKLYVKEIDMLGRLIETDLHSIPHVRETFTILTFEAFAPKR